MVITFVNLISFTLGEMFYFGSISCITDWSETRHHIANARKETKRQLSTALAKNGSSFKLTATPTTIVARPRTLAAPTRVTSTHSRVRASRATTKPRRIVASLTGLESTSVLLPWLGGTTPPMRCTQHPQLKSRLRSVGGRNGVDR